jgi:hypothetical protein
LGKVLLYTIHNLPNVVREEWVVLNMLERHPELKLEGLLDEALNS